MKKEIKDKWVKALRSGDYTQCVGDFYSKSDNSYCCLAVLTDVCAKEDDQLVFTHNQGELTDEIMEAAGIKCGDGSFFENGTNVGVSLINLNDEKAYSFKKIANVIEENWEQL